MGFDTWAGVLYPVSAVNTEAWEHDWLEFRRTSVILPGGNAFNDANSGFYYHAWKEGEVRTVKWKQFRARKWGILNNWAC